MVAWPPVPEDSDGVRVVCLLGLGLGLGFLLRSYGGC